MERLLTRTETDTHIIYTAGHTRFRFDKRDASMLQRVFDLSYAYEATGLEPEEVRSLRMDMAIIKAMFGDADVKHMKELCEADKEGRLVVLPCKVGEIVYYVLPDRNEYFGYLVSEPHRVTEVGTRGFWTSAIPDDEPDAMSDFTPWGDFGKTVFLTRAEAEAALGGAGDG